MLRSLGFSVLITFVSLGAANADEPVLTPIKQYENAAGRLMDEMDTDDKASYGLFLSSYSSLSAVKSVREAVKTGIGSCALQNPELKDTYNAKFEGWNTAISSVVEEADQVINNTIKVQRFAPVTDLREVMNYFDQAMTYREDKSKENEVPVSDVEGCQKLLDSMDDTQANLTHLIRESFGLKPSSDNQSSE